MKHHFEPDQRARNRRGEYTVIALDGDNMSIRYDDGIESVVSQAMQVRIQENMRIDEQVAQEEKVRAAVKRSTKSASGGRATWGRTWSGFAESDLQESTTGTHWRSRSGLGGAIAIALSTLVKREMESTAPWRIAETHIYDPKAYDKKHRNAQSKFVVKTLTEGVWYGFYVERSIEPMDDTWDWQRLVPALRQNVALQNALWQVMDTEGLILRLMSDGDVSPLATISSASDGEISLQHYDGDEPAGDAETTSWNDVATFLAKGRPGEWMNLYAVKSLTRNEAIESGQALAQDTARLMSEMWPLYQACAGKAS